MKKLILTILAAGTLLTARAQHSHGGSYGGGYYHGGHYGGFGYGAAGGFLVGSAIGFGVGSAYWGGYGYYPYYGYYGYGGYAPAYYYDDPVTRVYPTAPATTTAPAPAAQSQPNTVIINNYYNTTPMSGANSLFGR